jgi:hypothetical protein
VPHVQQRFLVHGFVLENREHCFGAIEEQMPRPFEIVVLERGHDPRVGLVRKGAHFGAERPAAALVAARVRLRLVRIDAAREQRFERCIDAGPAEPLLDQRIEAEAGQVPFVEHQRMAERDRPRVVRLVGDEVEQRLRPRAVARVPVDQVLSIER